MPVTTRTGKCFSVGIAGKKNFIFTTGGIPGLDSVGAKKNTGCSVRKNNGKQAKKRPLSETDHFLGKVFLVGGFNPFEKY